MVVRYFNTAKHIFSLKKFGVGINGNIKKHIPILFYSIYGTWVKPWMKAKCVILVSIQQRSRKMFPKWKNRGPIMQKYLYGPPILWVTILHCLQSQWVWLPLTTLGFWLDFRITRLSRVTLACWFKKVTCHSPKNTLWYFNFYKYVCLFLCPESDLWIWITIIINQMLAKNVKRWFH